jgi:hypothetical protein
MGPRQGRQILEMPQMIQSRFARLWSCLLVSLLTFAGCVDEPVAAPIPQPPAKAEPPTSSPSSGSAESPDTSSLSAIKIDRDPYHDVDPVLEPERKFNVRVRDSDSRDQ